MADLKTNYQDDILNTEVNTQRKYRMVQNNDGTVSFEDATDYSQVGDSFGAADINKTNLAIADLNNALDDCFQSVSNGKALVASAITGKGVTTASDATFETMANNIKNIVTSASIKSCAAIGLRQSLTGAIVGAYYLVMVTSQDAFSTVTGGASVIARMNTDASTYSGWYMTLCIVKATSTTITAGGTQYNYWAKINL